MQRFESFPHCDEGWRDYRNRYEFNRPAYYPEIRQQRQNTLFGCIPLARTRAETAYGRRISPYWRYADYHLA